VVPHAWSHFAEDQPQVPLAVTSIRSRHSPAEAHLGPNLTRRSLRPVIEHVDRARQHSVIRIARRSRSGPPQCPSALPVPAWASRPRWRRPPL